MQDRIDRTNDRPTTGRASVEAYALGMGQASGNQHSPELLSITTQPQVPARGRSPGSCTNYAGSPGLKPQKVLHAPGFKSLLWSPGVSIPVVLAPCCACQPASNLCRVSTRTIIIKPLLGRCVSFCRSKEEVSYTADVLKI
jgi:hypothetical protein